MALARHLGGDLSMQILGEWMRSHSGDALDWRDREAGQ